MIAIYELRGQHEIIKTTESDAQIVANFMKHDKDYFSNNDLNSWGFVMNCKDTGIFTDNEGKVVISVGYDKNKGPTRIQFIGLEKEVLSVKNILTEKLNKEGYRLS